MEPKVCTHKDADKRLAVGDFEMALRIAGPMLEVNPADLTAWRIATWAMFGLEERETALTNMKSLVMSYAHQRRPIMALAQIKELEGLGEDVDELVFRLAALYGADSDRLVEADLAPPPLPTSSPVAPWPPFAGRTELIQQAKDAMAISWGDALTMRDDKQELPFIPLFSVLAVEDFVPLVKLLQRQSALPGDRIIEQGAQGNEFYIVVEGGVAIVRRNERDEETELTRLGPGAFFGEMALVSNAPRAAEVRAVEPTVLLRADKSQLEELATSAPDVGNVLVAFCHARMLENLIRVSPVLAPVPVSRRADLIARFSTDYIPCGTEVIKEGESGRGLYVIVSGQMQVQKREGREQVILANLGPGDLFGEISLLMRKPSTATVTATADTAVLVLSTDDFSDATSDYPELLKGAFDIAVAREVRNNSIVAAPAAAADEMILL